MYVTEDDYFSVLEDYDPAPGLDRAICRRCGVRLPMNSVWKHRQFHEDIDRDTMDNDAQSEPLTVEDVLTAEELEFVVDQLEDKLFYAKEARTANTVIDKISRILASMP